MAEPRIERPFQVMLAVGAVLLTVAAIVSIWNGEWSWVIAALMLVTAAVSAVAARAGGRPKARLEPPPSSSEGDPHCR